MKSFPVEVAQCFPYTHDVTHNSKNWRISRNEPNSWHTTILYFFSKKNPTFIPFFFFFFFFVVENKKQNGKQKKDKKKTTLTFDAHSLRRSVC